MAALAPFLPIDDLGFSGWQMVPVGDGQGRYYTAVRYGDAGIEIPFSAGDTGALFSKIVAHVSAAEALVVPPAVPTCTMLGTRSQGQVTQLPPSGLPLFAGEVAR